jgi:glycosyltransferase involved in cell wall biosynthesis
MIPGMPGPCPAVAFSALTVTCNDARRLAECLASVAFCAERIVVDLGSSDGSVATAEAAGARVVRHPHRPIVEAVWSEVVGLARHEWLVLLDPDEVLPAAIAPRLEAIVRSTPRSACRSSTT